MIIGRDLMVQLGLTANFKRQVLQWDGATVHMKEPRNLIGKSDLTKREMRKVDKDQSNESINSDPTFDNIIFNLSSGTS